MRRLTYVVALALALLGSSKVTAQRSATTIDGDDITIRGCVTRAGVLAVGGDGSPLLWSRGDIMLSAATGIDPRSPGANSRFFYWVDEDLGTHLGEYVEIKGELEEVKRGEIEIDRDDDVTTIELNLGGKKEKARVPTSWLGQATDDDDREYDIAVQRIDVKDVKTLRGCVP
jgi:hypothetical protein